MIQTHDLTALLAAIDAGDDGALPALADLLEEQGDRRAAGLRMVGDRHPHKDSPECYIWFGRGWAGPNTVPGGSTLDRMSGAWRSRGPDAKEYMTRSAAYLALAEALAQ